MKNRTETCMEYGEFPRISYHTLRPERAAVMSDYYREHWNENAVGDPLIAIHNAVVSLAEHTHNVPPKMERIAFDAWMRVTFGCCRGSKALFATYEARFAQLRQTPTQRLCGFIAANKRFLRRTILKNFNINVIVSGNIPIESFGNFAGVPPDLSMYDRPRSTNWYEAHEKAEKSIDGRSIFLANALFFSAVSGLFPSSYRRLQYFLKCLLWEVWRERLLYARKNIEKVLDPKP